MAYQDLTHPAQVMSREITATRLFLEKLGRFFSGTMEWMMTNSVGQRRLDMVHSLERRSDEELKSLGIKRDEIVTYVFRDIYYI